METQSLFQETEGGSIPTSPHNFSFKDLKVNLCSRAEVRDFIEKWHYSHNINGVISDYCFSVVYRGRLVGAAIVGRMAMANQWKKFGKKESDVTEIRRLVCIDELPKNSESFFIGYIVRWLKKNTEHKTVVSYADTDVGHEGVIYKASNFDFVGTTKNQKVIIFEGRKYHDKAVRTKYKGELKPFAKRLSVALLQGKATLKKVKGKNCFIYRLVS